LGLSWLLQGDEEKCQMTWLSSCATTELEHKDAVLTEFIDFPKIDLKNIYLCRELT
jgi:hypothetical protein